MSESNAISKDDMRFFLNFLSAKSTLIGPVNTGKVIEFREATADDILMDDQVSYKSLKEYYFPQTELMFTFKDDDVTDNTDIQGHVIFGARPCDLDALEVMKVVYTSGKYADSFFQRRFDKNLLIGVGCKNQKAECFCEEMGVDLEYSDFCDIMLADIGDSYIIRHLSEKGTRALESFKLSGSQLNPPEPTPGHPELTKKLSPATPLALDTGKNDTAYFNIIDWEKTTETCKGCGICTYICPTCYCFNFKDVSKKDESKRYKCWDSCMYPKFTLHASGHNPREHRHERYRQRVLHKYKYVPENFDGAVACTGCGRCVRSCPVGINIKDILKEIRKAFL